MYIIFMYDVNEKRVNRVSKICRKYLVRVQNSVFEGELTERKLKNLKQEVANVIDAKQDSIRIYKLGSLTFFSKDEIGVLKNDGKII